MSTRCIVNEVVWGATPSLASSAVWLIGVLVGLGVLVALVMLAVRRPKKGWAKAAVLLSFKHFPAARDLSVVEQQLIESLPFDAVNYGRHLDLLIREFLGYTLIISDYLVEHRRRTTAGREDHVEHRTVVAVVCDDLDLPVCVIQSRPRQVRWMVERIGKEEDIAIGFDKSFGEKFKVIGQDRNDVRKMLGDEDLRHFLLRLHHDNVELECCGRAFALHFHRPINPDDAWRLLEHANELRNIFLHTVDDRVED